MCVRACVHAHKHACVHVCAYVHAHACEHGRICVLLQMELLTSLVLGDKSSTTELYPRPQISNLSRSYRISAANTLKRKDVVSFSFNILTASQKDRYSAQDRHFRKKKSPLNTLIMAGRKMRSGDPHQGTR